MTAYRVAVRGERGGEVFPAREPAHAGDRRAVCVVLGQLVRLTVVQVLQPMFDGTQERIRGFQLRQRVRREQAAGGEAGEHLQRRAHAQRRVPPGAHQLQGLGDELDFADAARAELDVVDELAARDLAPHFIVQASHRGERGEIEVLAIHERPHHGLQRLVLRAGDRAGLDPGVAFPFAALGDEIILQRVQAGHQRAAFAVGAQAHVDAKHEAVRVDFAEYRDEALAEAREEFVRRERRRAVGLAFLGVDEHQVDVRRHVQFTTAQLAHADDDEFLRGTRGGPRHPVPRLQLPASPVLRHPQARLGKRGHGAADLGERGRAGQVARHGAQEHTLAQAPEPCFQARFVIVRGTVERRCEKFRCHRTGVGGSVGGALRMRQKQAVRVARQCKQRGRRGGTQGPDSAVAGGLRFRMKRGVLPHGAGRETCILKLPAPRIALWQDVVRLHGQWHARVWSNASRDAN